MRSAYNNLNTIASITLPRVLTQICRDPDSPAYGSCDRNWWHYKIRDFSSIILQQAGYLLFCASELPMYETRREPLRKLAAASCTFWNARAQKARAFEEYYPWEEGYPPVAFSALGVSKLIAEGIVDIDSVRHGIEKAAEQLQSRFEEKASNQQLAGTAALCWIRKLAPELVDGKTLESICTRILEAQEDEGWFPEYGGPDLGYLSVSIDCLWDAYDATGDERFLNSAKKALGFIDEFSHFPTPGLGMHNARNTDYLVPYGVSRFLNLAETKQQASGILEAYFGKGLAEDHFLAAIDDRYYSHYYGHSVYRSLTHIRKAIKEETHSTKRQSKSHHLSKSGYYIHNESEKFQALVSCRKGGIITMWFGNARASDYGWTVKRGHLSIVSHWWEDFWVSEISSNEVLVTGMLTPHKENESTPLKHALLRISSLILGHRLIGILKEKLIFKTKSRKQLPFSRKITFNEESISIEDQITVPEKFELVRSPRSSKRHVASADSYHIEDLVLVDPALEMEETRADSGETVIVHTTYRLKR